MRYPEEELLNILRDSSVDFTCSLPCDRIKNLIRIIAGTYGCSPLCHVPLTREEEGVGICAGAALSGRRPAMFIQNSGMGNMINALLSLTSFYRFPLAVFISHRGVYKEKIAAQKPMGEKLPGILEGAGISYSVVNTADDFRLVRRKLAGVYKKNNIHCFLLSPAVWEGSGFEMQQSESPDNPVTLSPFVRESAIELVAPADKGDKSEPKLTRFEMLNIIAPHLDGKIVICNIGLPSKELFHIRHQASNFYMLGSMGMATPIGLGVALTSEKEVVVIDGDGSLLMNPGTLATAASFSPDNLTILAIDNGAYGSTGNQPTLTGSCVDLEVVAQGFGIKNTLKVTEKRELAGVMKKRHKGLRFIHALAVPGNKNVENITLDRLEIKMLVQEFIRKGR